MMRLLRACKHSLEGLVFVFKGEAAFRQEIYLGLLLIPSIFYLHLAIFYKLFLFLLYVLVLVVEIINSAIETIVDRISTEKHIQSKMAKDMGSAAVCLTLLMNVIAWVVILTFL